MQTKAAASKFCFSKVIFSGSFQCHCDDLKFEKCFGNFSQSSFVKEKVKQTVAFFKCMFDFIFAFDHYSSDVQPKKNKTNQLCFCTNKNLLIQ